MWAGLTLESMLGYYLLVNCSGGSSGTWHYLAKPRYIGFEGWRVLVCTCSRLPCFFDNGWSHRGLGWFRYALERDGGGFPSVMAFRGCERHRICNLRYTSRFVFSSRLAENPGFSVSRRCTSHFSEPSWFSLCFYRLKQELGGGRNCHRWQRSDRQFIWLSPKLLSVGRHSGIGCRDHVFC